MRPYWRLGEAAGAGDMLALAPDGKRMHLARGEPLPATEVDIGGINPGELPLLTMLESTGRARPARGRSRWTTTARKGTGER